MALPLVLVLVPAALFLLSCNEDESESKKTEERKPSPPSTAPCTGSTHELGFGPERFQLCHLDSSMDGIFQPDSERLTWRQESSVFQSADSVSLQRKYGAPSFEGLHLSRWVQARNWVFAGGDWSPTAEFMAGGLARQLQSEEIPSTEVLALADQFRPSGAPSRVAALTIAGALLSLQKEDSEFTRKNRPVLNGMIEGIRQGTLRVLPEPAGQKAPAGLMVYRSDLDAVLAGSLEPFRDTFSGPWFRSGLLHELYHYHQDSQARPKDHLMGEREAYLFQAEYLSSRPKAELDRTVEGLKKIYTEHPIFGALQAIQASSAKSPEAQEGLAAADRAIQDIQLDLMFSLLMKDKGAFIRPAGAATPEEALKELEKRRLIKLKEVRKIAGKPGFAESPLQDRQVLLDPLSEYLRLSVSAIGYRYAVQGGRRDLESMVREGKNQVKAELRGYPVFQAVEMRLDGVRRR